MFCCKSSKKDTAEDQTNVAALRQQQQQQAAMANPTNPTPVFPTPPTTSSSQPPVAAAVGHSPPARPISTTSSLPGPFAAYSHGDGSVVRAPPRPPSISGQSVRSRISLAYRADGADSFDGRRSAVSGAGSTRSVGGALPPRKVVVMGGVLDMRIDPDHKSKRPSFVMKMLIQAMNPQLIHIRTLLLSGNTLDEASAMQLAHWVSRNGTLDTLKVSSCRLGPLAGDFMHAICSGDLCRLRTIDLSYNKIDLHTSRAIAQAIGLPTSPISNLIIHHNNITLEGVVDFLRCNCLTLLDVCADFATPNSQVPFGIDGETWHRVTAAFDTSFRNLLHVLTANRSVTTLRFSRDAFNPGQVRLVQQAAARSPIGPSVEVLFTDSEEVAVAPLRTTHLSPVGASPPARRSPPAAPPMGAAAYLSPMHSQPNYSSPMRSSSPTNYYEAGGRTSPSPYSPPPVYHNAQASSSVDPYPAPSYGGYGAGPSSSSYADPYGQPPSAAAPWYTPSSPGHQAYGSGGLY